jgi:antibiotic biosynthesis monooxygenase (ABM) superfamily enzyme
VSYSENLFLTSEVMLAPPSPRGKIIVFFDKCGHGGGFSFWVNKQNMAMMQKPRHKVELLTKEGLVCMILDCWMQVASNRGAIAKAT